MDANSIARQALTEAIQRWRRTGTLPAESSASQRSGWTVKSEVRVGAPLASLLKAVAEHRADVLVLGARGTSRLALRGSVANGALNSSSVVLLVR